MKKTFIFLFYIYIVFSYSGAGQFRLAGYSSFEYEKSIIGDGGDKNGSFDSDLFDLVLNFLPTNRVRIAADITWEHGTASEDNRGNAAIEYAISEFTLSSYLKFRVGKMFTPFGIYNEIHTAKPAMLSIKEPFSTNKNDKFGSENRFYPRWGTGAALLGASTLGEMDFDYILCLSNGENTETNPFAEDNNQAKAITGRVRADFSEYFKAGFSVYNDWITSGEQQFSIGSQLIFDHHFIGLEIESVYGFVGDLDRWGSSAMLFYYVNGALIPYVRFEHLDPDLSIDMDDAFLLVYGLNMQLEENYFLKIDLNTVSSLQNNLTMGKSSYTEIKTSISVGF